MPATSQSSQHHKCQKLPHTSPTSRTKQKSNSTDLGVARAKEEPILGMDPNPASCDLWPAAFQQNGETGRLAAPRVGGGREGGREEEVEDGGGGDEGPQSGPDHRGGPTDLRVTCDATALWRCRPCEDLPTPPLQQTPACHRRECRPVAHVERFALKPLGGRRFIVCDDSGPALARRD
ncbi:hypothetical protein EYF80_027904 [Liparis tanakae]|uniref:Uncharacterized protein n=1 Tax=Liparis tanakae TaxID=230148 RepID=A0A4Z2H7H6_9TELE|nr:hypothetical protein EYF80_027904 [Liparis tanakae]